MRRIEIFSDGVFAIAITLLVLELPFDEVEQGELGAALREHWRAFAAYAVSFLTIGIVWMQHNAFFDALERADRRVLLLNLILLLFIAFVPFPTTLLGDYLKHGGEDARLAVVIYSGTWLGGATTLTLLWIYAAKGRRLLRAGVSEEGIRTLLRYQRFAVGAYFVFTFVALISPRATLALYSAMAIFFLWRADYAALGEDPGRDTGRVR